MEGRLNYLKSIITIVALVIVSSSCGKDSSISGPDNEISTPTIASVAPEEGSIGTELTITGTGFGTGASVSIDDIDVVTVEVESPTKIFAKVPSGITGNTPLTIKVSNSDGGEATLTDAFTAIDPVLSFVNSATKPSGNPGSTVIIDGRAFGDEQGEGEVLFSDGAGGTLPAVISSPDDWTDSFIVTTVPTGADDGSVFVTTAIGSSDSLHFDVTDAATFSPSTINWSLTTPLPGGVSGHKAVYTPIDDVAGATNRYVHITGGRDTLAVGSNQTLFGLINQDGSISSWNPSTSLPDSIAHHASVVATPFNSKVSGNGYLYTLGGADNSGEPVTAVYTASLNEDGSVNSWSHNGSLPEPLHSLGAVIFRSTVYIAGGATDGNTPSAKVYKAAIDTLGNLGSWEELTSLPSARVYHGFFQFGAFLYSVGGETAAESPDDGDISNNDTKLTEVAFARLNLRTGDINENGWSINANEMGKSRSKHSTLSAGGNIFVSSGLYSAATQGSSENIYAQINSDGTVGEFNGATGDNTLGSEGGNNLFNQAAISYVDGDGISHVMIIGGDDVGDPGNKQQEVLYY